MKRETIVMFNIVLALLCIGVLMVYSASAPLICASGDVFSFLRRHLEHVAIALGVMVIAACFNYHRVRDRRLLWPFLATTFVLLVLVLFLGEVHNGARRWISILGFAFQPSEFAKVAVVLLLAVKLSENQDQMRSFFRGFTPPLLMSGMFIVLILCERDLGTPVVLGCVVMLMMIMAGARWWHAIACIGPGVAGVAVLCLTSPHRLERLRAFLDPEKYRLDEGFQLFQSLAAFARGAMFGQGIGAGQQKLHYLPAAINDFIFAVVGEEAGLAGSLLLVALFVGFLILGIRIAVCARDLLGSLLAAGIVSLIATQTIVNMTVTTGMVPTKGLPLPFISAGGSSLIANLLLVGILLNVGAQALDRERQNKWVWAAQPQ